MGKYMRKAKISGEVAVMEVVSHQSSLGVRTRAKTLALQRLQKPMQPPSAGPLPSSDSASYLQLRSRRLEKPPPLASPRAAAKAKQTCMGSSGPKPNPSDHVSKHSSDSLGQAAGSTNSGSVGSAPGKSCSKKSVREVEEKEAAVTEDEGVVEVSFGENVLEVESRDRNSRETTPCSLVRDSEMIRTPGSTTRRTSSNIANRRTGNAERRSIPTTHEMEEFFAGAEQLQRRIFTEKYNYDPVNDCPLPGRYEWVRLDS